MKSKITCFISSLAAGGAEHQMAILANMLCDKGYDVEFVTCLDDNDYYSLNRKIKRIHINTGNSNVVAALKMIKYFRTVKTDVVISFRERMNLVALLGTLGRNIKVIAGERNLTINKPTSVGILNQQFMYYFADNIVSNSKAQANYLIGLRKKWARRVSSIINYTDLSKFKAQPEPQDDKVIKIGVFARFAPQKNCLNFIEAIAKVCKMTNRPFEIHWYGQRSGKINNDYYAQVEAKIKEKDISDIFILHDAVTNVSDKMHSYHAIALPSVYEGFSNSIAEGICCGNPMLVSRVSDNADMVHNLENGLLFDPNDVSDIANSICRFLSLSKDERLSMGRESRAIAETLFNADNFVNSYINLIEN